VAERGALNKVPVCNINDVFCKATKVVAEGGGICNGDDTSSDVELVRSGLSTFCLQRPPRLGVSRTRFRSKESRARTFDPSRTRDGVAHRHKAGRLLHCSVLAGSTTLTTTGCTAFAMSSTVPPYASQFKYLTLSFPSDNVLHVELKRSLFHHPFSKYPHICVDRSTDDLH